MSDILFQRQQIEAMAHRYRVNFINCLSGYKSANLVGTADADGHTNLAMVSSVVHLGADPALMGMVTRPRSVARHSVDNLQAMGVYTLNHVSRNMVPQAHQTAARYPREQSEFDATGLQAAWVPQFAAPYVSDSPLSIGLRLVEIKHLECNGTDFVIGAIEWVRLPGQALQEDGFVDLNQLDTVSVSGLDSYHPGAPSIGRFHYPKPDLPPRRQ
ncbi:MAG: flavin reductase [Pseudomonadota bacterium]|nr:flavin reductase [Pseudomonadota bacterium]